MTILQALSARVTGRNASGDPQQPRGDAPAGSAVQAHPPFAGYDRLDEKRAVAELSEHSQVELEAVESYERSHRDRQPVLDKLRYLRGPEPLPSYDDFSGEQIAAALEGADLATIKKVRNYERKFANRRHVLEEVARLQHLRQATEPASAVPSYRPMSARTAASPRGGRSDRA